MSHFKQVNQKIEDTVVSGYKKIEEGVVSGYKKIEEGAVSGYRSVAPLWLGPESGLTVLSVSADGTAFEDFYLDKK